MSPQFLTIGGKRAKEMAINFVQQHHSVLSIKNPVLKEKVWIVEITVSITRKIVVEIDAITGEILSWY